MHEDLGGRLKRARETLGYTQKGIAEAVGSKLRSWQDYEAGKKVPGSQVIAGLARLGIDANWLLTGEGEMLRRPKPLASPEGGIDREVLRDVVEVVEEVTRERHLQSLTPKKKAELILLLCDEIMEQEQRKEPSKHKVARLLRLIG